jgi:hypothetical protein
MLNAIRLAAAALALALDGLAIVAIISDPALVGMGFKAFPFVLPPVNLVAILVLLIERRRVVNAQETRLQEISAEKHAQRLTIAELKRRLAGNQASS